MAFAAIVGGVLIGVFLRSTLPGHHLADDAKDVVRLGTGLIATIAALVLSLLISSAKTSFDSQNGQVQHMTADIILLDHLLAQYGPETRDARDLLRRAIGPLVDRIWRKNGSEPAKEAPFAVTAVAEDAMARIDALAPQTDTQRSQKARAVQVVTDLTQTRLLLFEQSGKSIPVPFLAVMVFWLAIIFMSFSLFSRLNPTVIVALFVFAPKRTAKPTSPHVRSLAQTGLTIWLVSSNGILCRCLFSRRAPPRCANITAWARAWPGRRTSVTCRSCGPSAARS